MKAERISGRRRVDHGEKITRHKPGDITHTVAKSEIIFLQTLPSLQTGIREEETDSIEFKSSGKLITR